MWASLAQRVGLLEKKKKKKKEKEEEEEEEDEEEHSLEIFEKKSCRKISLHRIKMKNKKKKFFFKIFNFNEILKKYFSKKN